MSKPFPQSKEAWQTAVFQGLGLSTENGRSLYAAQKFPYDDLKSWFNSAFSEGYHPDFVPALTRNVIGFADWVYGNGGEPNWSKSDEQVINYRNNLPQKRMGAGALFLDEHDRILLVEPSYKPVWEIPGGVVEKDESPRQCCQREVLEELGLEADIGNLLLIDYNAPTDVKSESLMFIFDGGTLTQAIIEQIKIDPDELHSFNFFSENSLPDNMTQSLKTRVLRAFQNKQHGGDCYFDNLY